MIIDVRTPKEFEIEHVDVSINIPLNEVMVRVNEIKTLTSPLIICCASGVRSSQVHAYLIEQGIWCTDGGSYKNYLK